MKNLFDELNNILPNSPGSKSSKWEVLTKCEPTLFLLFSSSFFFSFLLLFSSFFFFLFLTKKNALLPTSAANQDCLSH